MPNPLELCLQVLSGLGESGQIVWELGKLYTLRKEDPLTEGQRFEYLKTSIEWLRQRALQKDRWATLPVDFRTFAESPRIMRKMGILWPEVLKEGMKINSGQYTECVLTGGIGVAKSTLAIYTQAYQVYQLSCMYDPHAVFDLDPSSEIMIVFQSVNKNVATDVDYRRLRDAVSGSPYFEEKFPFQRDRESDMRFPKNIVVKPVSGHDQAAIGQNVIGGILDEVNYMMVVENSKQTRDGSTYDQAVQNYNAIARRRESRFMQAGGSLPGMLCLVSSRNYPGQFTDQKEKEAKTNPRIYVYDKRLWELKPERFTGDKFRVFIGDVTRKPRIMLEGEKVAEQDARLVMDIPTEYRPQFDTDILAALRDIGGVSTQALHPFMMDVTKINAAFGKVTTIASREECDFVETKVALYPRRFRNRQFPRFAHIDLAISRDSAGVSVGHVPGFTKIDRNGEFEILPIIEYDLLLAVKPPRGAEIEFGDLRRLLYTLRKLGLPLKWVTCDSFQSKDMLQILTRSGFITGYQSMDVDTSAYDVLRQAIYDSRVRAPKHAQAAMELTRLEIDPKTQAIDHPPNGSKDVSDSMAGVAIGLTMRREIWLHHGVSMRHVPASVTAVIPPKPSSYRETVVLSRGMERRDARLREESMSEGRLIIPDSQRSRVDKVVR